MQNMNLNTKLLFHSFTSRLFFSFLLLGDFSQVQLKALSDQYFFAKVIMTPLIQKYQIVLK